MEERNEMETPVSQAQRLCSEIQLFDLCELERCGHKNGRFCTDTNLLAKFERISEEETYRIEPGQEQSDDDDCSGDYDDDFDASCEGDDEDRWEE
ncbi:hypothetical protein [Geobacter sp. SVR]|uniref:hypothetical protein n=1 Tax=Geobacter sp. SVR TaxID=2495594 RepID=UPI00143F04C9|nr:hypothetical protein [Geobacter sp. SVR]BCS53810.1 hypothetical protein GSVR_21180 [Geobacter sp. SVR]GCF85681.1 hypothetical protein GSbR_22810 [Geobacter sp. SVR]